MSLDADSMVDGAPRARRDRTRTVLVLADDPALWARLRSDLPERLVFVRPCSADQVETVLDEIDPWPWLVVGHGNSFPKRLNELARRRPIPVLWWGDRFSALPGHARCFKDWRRLLEASRGLLEPTLPGFRFLPVRGLETTFSPHLLSAELEALAAVYPSGLPMEARSVRRVNSLLQRHRFDWRAERRDGVVVLISNSPVEEDQSVANVRESPRS
jgi:hypothetical protein